MCFACRDEWHGYLTSCEANLERKFKLWAQEHKIDIRFCPMCRTKIEKDGGCNHMQCRLCGYQFCWICLAPASYEHFMPVSFFSCGVDLYQADHLSFAQRFLYKLAKYLAVLLGLVIVAFALAPYSLAH